MLPQDPLSLKQLTGSTENLTRPGAAPPPVPLISIRARRSQVTLNLSELWAYRDLFYLLALRDLLVRYKQTVLGIGWAVIQPLLATIVFTLFFGRLAKMPSDGVPYPIYVFAAMTLWTFFANSITNGGNSLVGNANLITKVYFPRLIMPAAAVAGGLVDFGIAFIVQLGMDVYYRMPIGLSILMVPAIVVGAVILATAVGLWMSALNVKYRDIRYAMPFMIQLWMFATPIVYPASLVPDRWRWVLALNPMASFIAGFRAALFGLPQDWQSLCIAFAITLGFLIYSCFSFRRMEQHFADVV